MKTIIISLLLPLFFASCIPIKTAKDISGYHIVDGNKNTKDEIKKANKFVFQVYKPQPVFERFLRERYSHIKGFSPDYFTDTINGDTINFNIFHSTKSSKHIDLISPILLKDEGEFVQNGKTKYYITIVATTTQGEDCLQTNSLYRHAVSKYLNELQMSFNAY